ncbi:MAG: circadian clock KaiB family protein [Chloroflexi bacterium]|nr:circadian clock KaiB family protein [Chloroflexota bacterium]MBV9134606.1 circadian clock KaiB family protein [Chloroflexota bacterium]MBV9894946.1 circadian clock KaiB family protein [Chloroflexota bacterium]
MTPQLNEGSGPPNGVAYVLALFITGQSVRSQQAVANLRNLCEHLGDGCELTVVDVLERPQAAEDERILATPTVIRRRPLPLRRVIGDLSDTEKLRLWLDLPLPVVAVAEPQS